MSLSLSRKTDQAFVRGSEGAGTTTLTVNDNPWQIFNLSAARNCDLPSTDVKAGDVYRISNRVASNSLTLRSSNGSTIHAGVVDIEVSANQDAPTAASHWDIVSISAVGTFTLAESSKTNLTGTGSFTTGKWVRNGNHVRAYINAITGYSVTTAANTRTFVIATPTGLPGVGSDITNSASGNAWPSNGSTDLGCMARIAPSGTNIIIDWTALSNYGTGLFAIYNIELTYQIG